MFKKIVCVLAFVGLFDLYFSLVLSQEWEWAGYETLERWTIWTENYNFYRLCAYGGGLLLVLMSMAAKANARGSKSRDDSGQFKPESDGEKEQ